MRSLVLFCFASVAAFTQPFSIGLKGGVPLTDFLNTAQSGNFNFSSGTNRYIVGAAAELRLPFGLGVELDALYRRLNYSGTGFTSGVTSVFTSSSTTGNSWEFPLVAKYRFPTRIVRPYVEAGVAWDTLQGLSQTVKTTVLASSTTAVTTTSHPAQLQRNTTTGFVMGAGLDIHALFLHVSPEIRYTRWGARQFLDPNGGIGSNQNQAEFLLGITL